MPSSMQSMQSIQSTLALSVFLAMNTLYKNRDQKGFVSFANELKGITASGNGWKIEPTGHVMVKPGIFNAPGLMEKLDQVFGVLGENGKRKYAWYQTMADRQANNWIEIPQLPKDMVPETQLLNAGYPELEENFKAGHGKYGENDCIEVGIFEVKEDETGKKALWFKHITRRAEENKANAFIGGQMFRREDLHKQRINEALEEFFSGCLFREGSETLRGAERCDERNLVLNQVFSVMSKKSEVQVLNSPNIKEQLLAIFANKQNLSFAQQWQQIQSCSSLVIPPYTVQDFDHALCLFKCELYKAFFPKEWEKFYAFMTQQFDILPVVQINGAAPSNTSLAFISSTISVTLLTKETFEASKAEWKLEEVAGDDASGVYTTLVEDLFASDDKMISFHPAYLLLALEHFCHKNPELFEDENIAQQIKSIKERVLERLLNIFAKDYGIGFNQYGELILVCPKIHGHYMNLVAQSDAMKEVVMQARALLQESPLMLSKAQRLFEGLQDEARTSVSVVACRDSLRFMRGAACIDSDAAKKEKLPETDRVSSMQL